MKVIVCCEGTTDKGPITVFMKKCLPTQKLDINCKTHAELKKIKLLKSESPRGFKKETNRINRIAYIRRSLHIANKIGSKHIGFHQDSGHQDYNKLYQDIHKDFDTVLPETTKRIAIIPKEMTESWLLTDEKAYPDIPENPKLPGKPEEIWGQKNKPYSNYPKNYFNRVIKQFNLLNNRDTYEQVAEKTDIETLKLRCPESFGKFYADMQSFIEGESA